MVQRRPVVGRSHRAAGRRRALRELGVVEVQRSARPALGGHEVAALRRRAPTVQEDDELRGRREQSHHREEVGGGVEPVGARVAHAERCAPPARCRQLGTGPEQPGHDDVLDPVRLGDVDGAGRQPHVEPTERPLEGVRTAHRPRLQLVETDHRLRPGPFGQHALLRCDDALVALPLLGELPLALAEHRRQCGPGAVAHVDRGDEGRPLALVQSATAGAARWTVAIASDGGPAVARPGEGTGGPAASTGGAMVRTDAPPADGGRPTRRWRRPTRRWRRPTRRWRGERGCARARTCRRCRRPSCARRDRPGGTSDRCLPSSRPDDGVRVPRREVPDLIVHRPAHHAPLDPWSGGSHGDRRHGRPPDPGRVVVATVASGPAAAPIGRSGGAPGVAGDGTRRDSWVSTRGPTACSVRHRSAHPPSAREPARCPSRPPRSAVTVVATGTARATAVRVMLSPDPSSPEPTGASRWTPGSSTTSEKALTLWPWWMSWASMRSSTNRCRWWAGQASALRSGPHPSAPLSRGRGEGARGPRWSNLRALGSRRVLRQPTRREGQRTSGEVHGRRHRDPQSVGGLRRRGWRHPVSYEAGAFTRSYVIAGRVARGVVPDALVGHG